MIITCIFRFLCQLQITDTRFNLYHTDQSLMMNTFGHDCIYCNRYESTSSSLIPFCIRPDRSNDEEKSCHGISITFKQLKTTNVSALDLFRSNAVIQIIDLYEKYLQFPELVHDNEVYCNCSILTRFGKSCQYVAKTKNNQWNCDGLIRSIQDSLVTEDEEEENHFSTCYIGLQCQTNLFCLDWRQICNGIVDCDHGEDEPADLCLQIETNQCHSEQEFRCHNGLCIPMAMASIGIGVCSDLSDLIDIFEINQGNILLDLCLHYPSSECDETNRGWKQFSCLNGQSIPYSDITSRKACTNNYHLRYSRKLFSMNDENQCWKSMICLTGFDYLYSHLNCSNQINIKDSCPNEYYFPSNSIVYSFVYFLYDQTNRTDWLNYSGPNSICYRREFCLNHTFNLPTFSKNNLTCFAINPTNFSWKNFYEYILHLFSPCFSSSSSIQLTHHPMFYRCNTSQSFISIYRVKDKKKDCFFNEDEDMNINLCSFNTNDHFQCLSNPNQCIRQFFLADNEYDCVDGSDEYFRDPGVYCYNRNCGFRPLAKRTLPEIYRFHELCDHNVDRHLFSLESNETDETDCEHWPYKSCDSYYTRCNRVWNCPNGLDEIKCDEDYNDYIQKALRCKSNEHYCIQLTNDSNVNATCIHLNRTGDGIIDCIGGTDERLTSICIEKYPMEFKRRFHCMNSSFCIRPSQVCDRINDCPSHDDELICPWLLQSNSSSSAFHCRNSSVYPVVRCEKSSPNNQRCPLREDLWFCDLGLESERIYGLPEIPIEPYPPVDQTSDSNQLSTSEKRTLSSIDSNSDPFLCNSGYPIQSSILNNKSYCLCSPSYYGDYCQYQSERLTVSLRLQPRYSMNSSTVFRLMIYLSNENHLILSYDQIVFNHKVYQIPETFLVYLMSERMINVSLHQQSKSKFVRIDSYIIKETDVQYISSWFFPVSFPFLPVNRLAAELRLVHESFQVIYCKKRCGSHGKCLHYINAKDKEYCWCNQGWLGEYCELRSSCNSTSCAPHSQCVTLNEEKKEIQCICPLGKSGDQCYITYNVCFSNPCDNNGTCLPLDQRSFEYTCICHDDYDGFYCDYRNRWSYISVDSNITELSVIPALITIIGLESENRFSQIYRTLFKNVALPTSLKIPRASLDFGFVQMFHNFSNSFYYVVSIQKGEGISPFVNTSVIAQNLCQNINEIFNETILNEYSYLKRLKLYHLPCNHHHNLRCFFDRYRMCICTRDHNSHCFLYNHESGDCNNCQNDGLCVREDRNQNLWNSICLCPTCTYGSFCQFAPRNYFITFDMLIGIDMKTGETSFGQQAPIIYLTLMFVLLLLIVSLIFNTTSIFVFSNKKLRQVGCDLYLLNLTIISQIGLILLFLRFIYMISIQMYAVNDLLFVQISCISLEYLIRLIPSLFDWLTVCISIERVYTVIKGVQFTKVLASKSLKWSRWIVLIVFVVNILTTLHRPFYLTLVDELDLNDEPRGHPWCVLNFASSSWNIYEKIINICHLIIPFILNLLSIIGFISHKINVELTSTTRKNQDTRLFIIKEQLLKYKPIVISTVVILLLEIPRFVLTFTLACIEHAWERYVYLIGYFISFLPLTGVLFIYILPSPKYKKQLQTFARENFRISLFKNS